MFDRVTTWHPNGEHCAWLRPPVPGRHPQAVLALAVSVHAGTGWSLRQATTWLVTAEWPAVRDRLVGEPLLSRLHCDAGGRCTVGLADRRVVSVSHRTDDPAGEGVARVLGGLSRCRWDPDTADRAGVWLPKPRPGALATATERRQDAEPLLALLACAKRIAAALAAGAETLDDAWLAVAPERRSPDEVAASVTEEQAWIHGQSIWLSWNGEPHTFSTHCRHCHRWLTADECRYCSSYPGGRPGVADLALERLEFGLGRWM